MRNEDITQDLEWFKAMDSADTILSMGRAERVLTYMEKLEDELTELRTGIMVALYDCEHLDDAAMHMQEYHGINNPYTTEDL